MQQTPVRSIIDLLSTFPGPWRVHDARGAILAESANIARTEHGIWRAIPWPLDCGRTITLFTLDFS